MRGKLMSVRHKGHTYVSRLNPNYENVVQIPNTRTKVDEIEMVPSPDNVHHWISILTYLADNKLGDLRVRIEECDQFFYIREDK